MRKNISEFAVDLSQIDPYVLDLEDGGKPIELRDSRSLITSDEAEAIQEDATLKTAVLTMCEDSADGARAWATLRHLPLLQVKDLVEDVTKHFQDQRDAAEKAAEDA